MKNYSKYSRFSPNCQSRTPLGEIKSNLKQKNDNVSHINVSDIYDINRAILDRMKTKCKEELQKKDADNVGTILSIRKSLEEMISNAKKIDPYFESREFYNSDEVKEKIMKDIKKDIKEAKNLIANFEFFCK